jgi:hypothetical protein
MPNETTQQHIDIELPS